MASTSRTDASGEAHGDTTWLAAQLRVEAFEQLHHKDDVAAVQSGGRWWITCTNGDGEAETYLVVPASEAHPAEVSGRWGFVLAPSP